MRAERRQAILELLAEVLLSFLPMILVMIVLLHQGKIGDLFSKPEWAFGSAIFFGQAIVRLVASIAHHHKNLHAGFLSVVVVLLILFGLGPSCSLVVIVLFSHQEVPAGQHAAALAPVLQGIQVVLYVLSSMAYIFVGATARELGER